MLVHVVNLSLVQVDGTHLVPAQPRRGPMAPSLSPGDSLTMGEASTWPAHPLASGVTHDVGQGPGPLVAALPPTNATIILNNNIYI